MRPGDVIIINDPYLGGTHLMDVRLVKPYFYKGRLWAWLANSAHWADIGGSVAGGFSSDTWEVHQEGLRLPPIRIAREGKLDEDLLALILANCRVPQERVGDFKAQMAALNVGERRLTALLDRYGVDVVDNVIAEVRTRAEKQMRAHIESLPDGRYTFEAPMDSDGIRDDPLWVRLDLDVKGSDLYLDFSRSSPPCRGPMNTPFASTKSAVYIGVRHVFPDVPLNAGGFEPIHIKEAKGTFLHAEYPKPVAGAAAECSQRVVETVLGALPSTSATTSCTTSAAAATAGTGPAMATPTRAPRSRSRRRSRSRCSSRITRCCSRRRRCARTRPAPDNSAAASAFNIG